MDRGPWWIVSVTGSKAVIASHDFEHDVCLEITGDFASKEEREQYAQWLAEILSGEKRIEDPRTESKREGVEL